MLQVSHLYQSIYSCNHCIDIAGQSIDCMQDGVVDGRVFVICTTQGGSPSNYNCKIGQEEYSCKNEVC